MKFRDYITQFNLIDPALVDEILNLFKRQIFLEKDHLLRVGEVSDKIWFIESGVICEYSLDEEGVEQVYWILGENQFVSQIESYISEKPSYSAIRAIGDTTAMCIDKAQYKQLISEFPQILPLIVYYYENSMMLLDQRNRLHRIKSGEVRLNLFEKNNAEILNQIPLKTIASFLNITPSELSRIRKKRSLQ